MQLVSADTWFKHGNINTAVGITIHIYMVQAWQYGTAVGITIDTWFKHGNMDDFSWYHFDTWFKHGNMDTAVGITIDTELTALLLIHGSSMAIWTLHLVLLRHLVEI